MRSATVLDPLRDFSAIEVPTEGTTIFARVGGSGPPLLLLHGFPETHLMWREVASRLAREYSVVCADLRGYGRSGCPASNPDHEPYAERAMARDMSGRERRGRAVGPVAPSVTAPRPREAAAGGRRVR
jgi:alpha/beta hydrolase fold